LTNKGEASGGSAEDRKDGFKRPWEYHNSGRPASVNVWLPNRSSTACFRLDRARAHTRPGGCPMSMQGHHHGRILW